jgi:hypothetical protein
VPALDLELAFYVYAHERDETLRMTALRTLKRLLGDGVRSPDWPLEANVERARLEGHPEPGFLAAVAGVIGGRQGIEELDSFACWAQVPG